MPIGTTAAIIGASAIGAGASILGSSKSASAQAKAAQSAEQTQLYMFDQARQDSAPFMQGGYNALGALQFELGLGGRPTVIDPNAPAHLVARRNDLQNKSQNALDPKVREDAQNILKMDKYSNLEVPYAGFQATPGYEFMRAEGTKAIDRSAAARGMTRSGATLKAQDKFGQGIAAQEYGNYLNRLSAMSGFGQTSTGQINALGASTAANIGNAQMAAGAARGSAYQQMGQEVGNFAGNALAGLAYGGYLR